MFKCAADVDNLIDVWKESDSTNYRVAQLVGRALVVVFNNQLQSEQSSNMTRATNGIGFSQADARSGSLAAKTYLSNKKLNPWQLNKWLKKGKRGNYRISKYWKQLAVAAEAKKNEKNV